MSRSFVISDHHFYHENIIKYTGRPFAGVEEMHEVMIRCWNEVVGPDDEVWHLGKIRNEVLKKMKEKPVKNALPDQNKFP